MIITKSIIKTNRAIVKNIKNPKTVISVLAPNIAIIINIIINIFIE